MVELMLFNLSLVNKSKIGGAQVAHLKHRLSKGLKWAEAHSTEQLGEASRAAALAAAMQGMLSE